MGETDCLDIDFYGTRCGLIILLLNEGVVYVKFHKKLEEAPITLN